MTTVLVTGGAGYIGIGTCAQLQESGRTVRVLDALLHGQRGLADDLAATGVEVQVGDVRDPAARAAALDGIDEVVHLAAIVGDPACARDPQESHAVNVEGATALVGDAAAAGVQRFVFASTCSNYGRMADPTVPVTEDGELAPVSLYAEQKVGIEKMLLGGAPQHRHGMVATCLRFATIYGVAPRMRFDLTVNEFTRDLWAGRHLEVFGEQFWRPYVHVRDAGRAVRAVLEQPADVVGGQVFNVGRTDENYRKLDLVEAVTKAVPQASVSYVARDEDPRDYKVSFEKIARVLGFSITATVPEGIAEVIDCLETKAFGDPFAAAHRN